MHVRHVLSKPGIPGVVRRCLTCDAAVMAANVFVSSRLDYYNVMFVSLSGLNLWKLQCVHNNLVRIAINAKRCIHTSPVPKSLQRNSRTVVCI